MIKCTIPDSSPLLEFNGYGCYCGLGGSGTPVDELDRFLQLCCYKPLSLVLLLWFCMLASPQPYLQTGALRAPGTDGDTG